MISTIACLKSQDIDPDKSKKYEKVYQRRVELERSEREAKPEPELSREGRRGSRHESDLDPNRIPVLQRVILLFTGNHTPLRPLDLFWGVPEQRPSTNADEPSGTCH